MNKTVSRQAILTLHLVWTTLIWAPLSSAAEEATPTWTIAGVEIIGANSDLANRFAPVTPTVGSVVNLPAIEEFAEKCEHLRPELATLYLRCDAIMQSTGLAFLTIDLVLPSDRDRLPPSGPPLDTRDIHLQPQLSALRREREDLFRREVERHEQLGATTYTSEGYEVIDSPSEREFSLRAYVASAPNRREIVEVLLHASSRTERENASFLLPYLGHPEKTINQVAAALRDESYGVRNNTAGFMARVIQSSAIKLSDATLTNVASAMCQLSKFPTPYDRMKSLAALVSMLEDRPKATFSLAACDANYLQMIATSSKLSGDSANRVLTALHSHQYH